MTTPELLARLYTDADFRAVCLADPVAHGLPPDIDRVGFDLATESFARKRAAHSHAPRPSLAMSSLRTLIR